MSGLIISHYPINLRYLFSTFITQKFKVSYKAVFTNNYIVIRMKYDCNVKHVYFDTVSVIYVHGHSRAEYFIYVVLQLEEN